MRLIKIEPITVTVALSLADCICLYSALSGEAARMDSCDQPLCDALGDALLGHAFAAFLASGPDDPATARHMWEEWAPHDTFAPEPRKLPVPDSLPVIETMDERTAAYVAKQEATR